MSNSMSPYVGHNMLRDQDADYYSYPSYVYDKTGFNLIRNSFAGVTTAAQRTPTFSHLLHMEVQGFPLNIACIEKLEPLPVLFGLKEDVSDSDPGDRGY